ncbi:MULTISPECIES: DUF1064 domain-containing protein [unclassified Psychrobacter]|uniref:DUF1064 domain-containing protein n=1 Tax=unclassified Psychrobacter TaxID=196806 RepID=UPI0018F6420D|nr:MULTISPECIES: DUF1064 domain-containing protein [unclassified Psychrobacter]
MSRKSRSQWNDWAKSSRKINTDWLNAGKSDKPKMNKHGNIKTEVDGITFDSKGESERYSQLKKYERLGLIKDLRLQVKYVLTPKYKKDNGTTVRQSSYIADFVYFNVALGKEVVEDYKGMRTRSYIDKAKQMMTKYGIEIYETNKSHVNENRL